MAWVPTDVSGLLRWWKADSLALSNGAEVLSWTDSSANHDDATGSTGSVPLFKTNQLNGKPALDFAGGDKTLAHTLSRAGGTNTTFAFVAKYLAAVPAAAEFIFGAGDYYLQLGSDSGINPDAAAILNSGSAGANFGEGFRLFLATVNSAGSAVAYRDGTQVDAQNIGTDAIGASLAISDLPDGAPFVGMLAELLAYDSVLSADNQLRLTAYLKQKYGFALSGPEQLRVDQDEVNEHLGDIRSGVTVLSGASAGTMAASGSGGTFRGAF